MKDLKPKDILSNHLHVNVTLTEDNCDSVQFLLLGAFVGQSMHVTETKLNNNYAAVPLRKKCYDGNQC